MSYIVIEGVIGVGKTTLTRLLASRLAATPLLEVVEENPFLGNFYADRQRYAFQTETFFLLSRYRQQQSVVHPAVAAGSLVSDYLFAKTQLFAGLNLAGDEWDLFCQLYRALAERVATPTLVVYLHAGVDTLMQRIAQRDRPFERNMSRDYIAELAHAYDEWWHGEHDGPVLKIETDHRDLVGDEAAQEAVIGMIRAATAGYTQQPLLDA